jgi:alkylation response protein AidB-like acyl-CoA dehydrogenase
MHQMIHAHESGDFATASAVDAEMGFMTPIVKGFLTETGIEAASMGIQIFGGHGYIKGNRVEQIYRDVRIAAIWEGTTQIQVRISVHGPALSTI